MSLQSAVEAFGQRLGMPQLVMGKDGVTALDIADVGRLYLEILQENGHDVLLAYLARDVPPHDRDIARRALAFCHYRHGHALPVWAGIHNDTLVVLTRLQEQEATGQALENAALFLTESLHQLLKGDN